MNEVVNGLKEQGKTNKSLFFKILLVFVIILILFILFYNKKGDIEVELKSSLTKLVEKNDLETASIVYNVIAKKCKDNETCDVTSNNINDFEYVVSCKGTLKAGIDFNNVKIELDKKNKKLIVEIPDATIIGEPNINPHMEYLKGDEVPASKLPEVLRLCQETTLAKSQADNQLIPAAKKQATIVLEEFYRQWIKAYDSSYEVIIK